jgi:hypothetical protein
MAYIINRYNGTVLTSVEDGTINQTTELKFVGKNFSGYGEAQNENFLHLLENFASNSAPLKAISGQIWYDSGTSKLKFYDGIKWRAAGSTEVSNTDPIGLIEGDLWYKPSTKQLYAKTSDNNFVLIGPQVAGVDITQLISESVTDTVAASQPIIKATVNGEVVFIVSDTEFTLSVGDAIPGFDRIRRGITLVNTQASTGGVTTGAGNTGEAVIWGTASNALKLNGQTAADFVTSASAEFTEVVNTAEDGVLVNNTLQIYVNPSSNLGIIENKVGDTIQFNITDGTTLKNIFKVTNVGLIPNITNTYNIGTSSFVWNNVYATNFVGNASSATALLVAGTARTGSTASSPNTVAVRDASSDIYANIFNGTATKARYADLAEKYTTDKEYPVGTVMQVCSHPDHETEACALGGVAIGVISENPAYLMNNDCEGQAIGLKGRVPVRVVGHVNKGQSVYAWSDGVASTVPTTSLVGIALETNSNDAEKLVECVLKV